MNKSVLPRREENKNNVFLHLFSGAVIGFVLFLLLIFVFTFLEFKGGFGNSLYLLFLMISAFVSAFVNGFVSVRPFKRCGAPYGAASGSIQALICFVLSFLINRAHAGKWAFILLALIIIASASGGILAANLRIRKKY